MNLLQTTEHMRQLMISDSHALEHLRAEGPLQHVYSAAGSGGIVGGGGWGVISGQRWADELDAVLGGGFGEGLDGFGGGGAGGFGEAWVWGWMGHGADEAFEIAMDGYGEEVAAFGRLGAVGVGDAFGCEPDVAGADAMLLALEDEAELAFEDLEDFVFGVVDVQWGGIAEGDAML